jgi:hypothetical protein
MKVFIKKNYNFNCLKNNSTISTKQHKKIVQGTNYVSSHYFGLPFGQLF